MKIMHECHTDLTIATSRLPDRAIKLLYVEKLFDGTAWCCIEIVTLAIDWFI